MATFTRPDGRVVYPLDNEYHLRSDESEFYKAQTGITDDAALEQHIRAVQKEAYAVFPYNCIRRFNFVTLKISRHPIYQDVLKLGKERPGAILLDIGCCFGNDARKAVADGYPIDQVLGSDLRPEFWELGHKLFKTTVDSFPVPFLAGDVFDPAFIAPAKPAIDRLNGATPDLSTLASLTPLTHRISAIHASSFFHLFNEEQQHVVAEKLAALLSPEPGSVIFGSHMGAFQKGDRLNGVGRAIFAHSEDSWKDLWDGDIFPKGKVEVSTSLKQVDRNTTGVSGPDGARIAHLLVYSIRRL
ncbi:hypothetical protein SISSUDRAFT_981979 [Sistotremastrum suecicum HHB10207 ss-3]|uniref:Methyltransferase domain-containing protein n=1 Tax=Sistotremastrum suecicum HHB10207 ss-3 TaxID=1314776 RepID=A0A166G6T6_9AGAM|nr:hypothetical protein SISSUDRAFT_981979 [Sistotremastrum suecicum HHB10207 ss-3]